MATDHHHSCPLSTPSPAITVASRSPVRPAPWIRLWGSALLGLVVRCLPFAARWGARHAGGGRATAVFVVVGLLVGSWAPAFGQEKESRPEIDPPDAATDTAQSAAPGEGMRTQRPLHGRIPNPSVHTDTLAAIAPQPFQLKPLVMRSTLRVVRNGQPVPPQAVTLDAASGRLWVRPLQRLERTDTLVAVYRTFPVALRTVYRRRSIDSTRAKGPSPRAQPPGLRRPASPGSGQVPPTDGESVGGIDSLSRPDTLQYIVAEDVRDSPRSYDVFEGVTLDRRGSITRGVAGGSNQNAAIESGLRLQLDGQLTEDVAVRAALTDQNTPIQPTGTTQRLDDFDRVFVELTTPQGTAQLGDIDVSLREGTFSRFDRKIQGARVQSATWGPALGLAEGEATVFGAVSRGQYRTQDLQPVDGVQGPYRLEGLQGERFIVVVAGTERVFLDGQELERGRSNDYVIDYTRAEIRFTPNRIITEDRRITVEFQYRTSQFDRTLVGGQAGIGLWARDDGDSRLHVRAAYIREADGGEFSSAFDLSPADSLALVQAGDDPAVRSSARRVEFDPEAPYIQYRREIRSTEGDMDTVFVALDQAPDEGEQIFRVRFSRVGEGNGAYDRVGQQQNGILYEYRGPGQGAYSPREPIPSPQKRQLVDLGGRLEVVSGVEVYGEWAQSLTDRNRFSRLDAADDRGAGYVAGTRIRPVSIEWNQTSLGTLEAGVERSLRGVNFETFDQVRPVEFNRRWNLSRVGSGPSEPVVGGGDEQIDRGEIAWQPTGRSRLQVEGGRLSYGSAFTARRADGTMSIEEEGVPRVNARVERITSTDRLERVEGTWLRQQYSLRQPFRVAGRATLTPFVEYEQETRDQVSMSSGEATPGAFSFEEWSPGIDLSGAVISTTARLAYRTEDETLDGRTRRAAEAWTGEAQFKVMPTVPFDLSARAGYRSRRFTDVFQQAGREDTESLLLGLDAGAQPWRRAVDARLFYDARTEREPTLQEVYVRTGPDLGQFVWEDANGDGLQQVDEFVPETTPNEGNYVQSFVPSDSLSSVVSIDSRFRLRLDPGRVWQRSDHRVKRWLARVETRSSVEIQENSQSGRLTRLYLLDPGVLRREGETIDGSIRWSQAVDLFPRSPVAGVDLAWTQSRRLIERAAGRETRFLNAWEVATRWRPATWWTLRLAGRTQMDRSLSDAFADSRSYDIRSRQIRPETSIRPIPSLQVTVATALATKRDDIGDRTARVIRIPVQLRWARAGSLRLTGRAEVSDIRLDGDAVGLARFELTDGRGPGRSYLWGAGGQYAVSSNVQASFDYDGRAPSGADVIHTFRIQVNARF